MKISIITPTYNSEATLRDTVESIFFQDYSNIEYIIIDGLSSDKTLDIVSEYQLSNEIKLVSEPDAGIYDAMNKGLALAGGDVVAILNSDDFYFSPDVLSKVMKVFLSDDSIDAVYGDLVYVDRKNINKVVRYWKSGEYSLSKLNLGWTIPHPVLFLRKRVYDSLNKLFDTSLSLAADYELILRLLKVRGIKSYYLPEVLVKMRAGGSSSVNLKQRMKGWRELGLSWKINNLKLPSFFIIKRVFFKLSQMLKRPKP